MKQFQSLSFIKFTAFMIVVAGLTASAFASCGDSLAGMAALAAPVANGSSHVQQTPRSTGTNGIKTSMVGLWHIEFTAGGQPIQEAFQAWNAGGTEVHNPKVDPRAGNVCLGVWQHVQHGAFKLAHRVWQYDANGNFGGTINLSETVNLSADGKTHSGSFTLDFYDPSGNFQFEVAGDVAGERITVN